MRWCHGMFRAYFSFFFSFFLDFHFHFHSFAIITPSSVSLNLFFMLILITTLNFMLKFVGSRHLVNWRSVKQFFGEWKSLNKFSLNLINFFSLSRAVVCGEVLLLFGSTQYFFSTKFPRRDLAHTSYSPANYVLCVWLALMKIIIFLPYTSPGPSLLARDRSKRTISTEEKKRQLESESHFVVKNEIKTFIVWPSLRTYNVWFKSV